MRNNEDIADYIRAAFKVRRGLKDGLEPVPVRLSGAEADFLQVGVWIDDVKQRLSYWASVAEAVDVLPDPDSNGAIVQLWVKPRWEGY